MEFLMKLKNNLKQNCLIMGHYQMTGKKELALAYSSLSKCFLIWDLEIILKYNQITRIRQYFNLKFT